MQFHLNTMFFFYYYRIIQVADVTYQMNIKDSSVIWQLMEMQMLHQQYVD